MFAVVKANQVIKLLNGGEPYIDDNGTQHPANIFTNWSTSELNKIGIYPVEYTYLAIDHKTERDSGNISYIINDTTVSSTRSKVDKDFAEVKTGEISFIKKKQNNLLSSTDWYYIRKMDKETAIPTDVQNYRDAVRTAGDKMVSDVTNAADKTAFQALYPVWDLDGNNTGGTLDV